MTWTTKMVLKSFENDWFEHSKSCGCFIHIKGYQFNGNLMPDYKQFTKFKCYLIAAAGYQFLMANFVLKLLIGNSFHW